MPSDFRERFQTTLGSAYTITGELGGGGMSRVFVADETALSRRVVVKVLPPELVAGVSVERFKREIQVAARLQHPHIVPLLSAGETEGLPFYTMPFVDGSSLRVVLRRGALTITDAVNVLREVARALAYAHDHGVVHRDIKPDNVLITGGSAVVTDFGIAKALNASRVEHPDAATLTGVGMALGTPAYMAPEQASGDPDTDFRADIYSFGCMAFELLTGRPPFHDRPLHKLMAAHLGERPRSVSDLRAETPPLLAELVAQCMEKDPSRRPGSAGEIARSLETITGGGTAYSATPTKALGGGSVLAKALAMYAGMFVVVVTIANAAIVGIGLPDWVLPATAIVMAFGLPLILATSYMYRATTATSRYTPGGSPAPVSTMVTLAIKAAPHLSWRRTALGGIWAVGALVAVTAGWMAMRALGIGPAASLVTAGKLGERERLIFTAFEGPETDSLLGPTVSEALRTDLAQSATLTVMPTTSVREALQRMQRPPNSPVDFTLAREIAAREGIKAIVEGQIMALGGGYVLSARLVATQGGEELAQFRETSADAAGIIPAISRMAKKLRERAGEPLRTIQKAQSLEQLTTGSLLALQQYVAAERALSENSDWNAARSMLEQAIRLDTTFAMAYRKLAIEMNNRDYSRDTVIAVIRRAYDHRERLSQSERLLTEAGYYYFGPRPDRSRMVAAYQSLLELDSQNVAALNNLAVQLQHLRQFASAELLAGRAIRVQSAAAFYNNVFWSQIGQGKLDSAGVTHRAFAQALPRNPSVARMGAMLLATRGDYGAAATVMDSLRRARIREPAVTQTTDAWLGTYALIEGRLTDAVRWLQSGHQASHALGNREARLQALLDRVEVDALFRPTSGNALRSLERALVEQPLDSIPRAARPYDRLVRLHALLGQTAKAEAMLAEFDRRREFEATLSDDRMRAMMLGDIAMAQRRFDDAVRAYRAADLERCVVCSLPSLARAYDLGGNVDSTIAVLERYIQLPSQPVERIIEDGYSLANAHRRLGELYQAKGITDKATAHYTRFVNLWNGADGDLQPQVRHARDQIAAMQRTGGR